MATRDEATDESKGENVTKRRGCYLSYLSNPSEKVPRTSKHRLQQSKDISSTFCPEEVTETLPIDRNDHSSSVGIDQTEINEDSDLREFLPEETEETEVDIQEQLNEEPIIGELANGDAFCCVDELINSDIGIDLHELSQAFPEDPALNDARSSDELLDDMEWNVELDEEEETENSDGFVKITEQSSKHDSPLYAGAPITFSVSMLLIVTFAMRHSLTGVALADLLTLINVHLVLPNCFAKSTSVLNRFFRQLKQPIEYHYYCTFCYQYIGVQKTACCSNKHCLSDFSRKGALAYFIVLPLVVQLQSLLESKFTFYLLYMYTAYIHFSNLTVTPKKMKITY